MVTLGLILNQPGCIHCFWDHLVDKTHTHPFPDVSQGIEVWLNGSEAEEEKE